VSDDTAKPAAPEPTLESLRSLAERLFVDGARFRVAAKNRGMPMDAIEEVMTDVEKAIRSLDGMSKARKAQAEANDEPAPAARALPKE